MNMYAISPDEEKNCFTISYGGRTTTLKLDFSNKILHFSRGKESREISFVNIGNYALLSYNDYQMFVMEYEFSGGRKKKLRVFAAKNDEEMQHFFSFFKKNFPGGDLSHLPENEALQMLRIVHPYVFALYLFMIIEALFFIIFYLAVTSDPDFQGDNELLWMLIGIFAISTLFTYLIFKIKSFK